jgi:hypothetical protein
MGIIECPYACGGKGNRFSIMNHVAQECSVTCSMQNWGRLTEVKKKIFFYFFNFFSGIFQGEIGRIDDKKNSGNFLNFQRIFLNYILPKLVSS